MSGANQLKESLFIQMLLNWPKFQKDICFDLTYDSRNLDNFPQRGNGIDSER